MINLSKDCRRIVTAANFMTYSMPSLHPDRVMADHDIVYMLDGEWEIFQDGVPYLLKTGDVLFLAAGHHHYGLRTCSPGLRTMFIHVSAAPNDRISDGLLENGLCFSSMLHCTSNMRVRRYFEDVIDTYWSSGNEKEIRISAYIDLLLCELSTLTFTQDRLNSSRIRDIQRIISLNPGENMTAEELAEQVHMSARSIRYYFRMEMGVSLHQYQMDTRLDMAFRLLQSEPNRTMRDIATTFGFYDEYHFSRLFKRKFGYPPSKVRFG